MMRHWKLHLLLIIAVLPLLNGCEKYPQNPNRPFLPYPIVIYPNSMEYQDLFPISGWVYINADVESTSRGIIVFHSPDPDNVFIAYDRMPPNEPDACADSQGNTTRLVVDGGWVIDHCNTAYYNIMNGQIIVAEPDMIPNFPTTGTTVYPLTQYHTHYDGTKLTITN